MEAAGVRSPRVVVHGAAPDITGLQSKDPVEAECARIRGNLIASLHGAGIADAERLADMLLGSLVHGPRGWSLRIENVKGQQALDVMAMPREAWMALQQHTQARGGTGIRRVDFSRKIQVLNTSILSGLKELKASLDVVSLSDRHRIGSKGMQSLLAVAPRVEVRKHAGAPESKQAPPSDAATVANVHTNEEGEVSPDDLPELVEVDLRDVAIDLEKARLCNDLTQVLRQHGLPDAELRGRFLAGYAQFEDDGWTLDFSRVHPARLMPWLPLAAWDAFGASGIQHVELGPRFHLTDPAAVNAFVQAMTKLQRRLETITLDHRTQVSQGATDQLKAALPGVALQRHAPPVAKPAPATSATAPGQVTMHVATPQDEIARLAVDMNLAMQSGNPQSARNCIRQVLASPLLDDDAKTDVLMLCTSVAGATGFVTVLSRMCLAQPPVNSGNLKQTLAEYDVMEAYLGEILDSTLPLEFVLDLCGRTCDGPQGEATAARLAMQAGHPAAAGVLQRAVKNCRRDDSEKAQLQAELGVSTVEVGRALRQAPWNRLTWIHELAAEID